MLTFEVLPLVNPLICLLPYRNINYLKFFHVNLHIAQIFVLRVIISNPGTISTFRKYHKINFFKNTSFPWNNFEYGFENSKENSNN